MMTTPHPSRPSAPRPLGPFRAGFSLIEILVTISIIVLLVGVTFPVALKMLASAETSTARGMLSGLAAAADDYNISTQATVDHKSTVDAFGNVITLDVGQPEPNTGTGPDATLGYFIFSAGQNPSTAQAIALATKKDLQLNNRPLTNINDDIANGNLTLANFETVVLLDPWDTQIRYAYKVSHSDSFTDDDYLPAHPSAYFASAGPDGLFGEVDDNNQPDATVDNNNDGVADAADNIYSFQTDQ